ncbi:MAG: hypothetical protein ABIG03_02455 [Candidatus Eisenbacteria bacterium]
MMRTASVAVLVAIVLAMSSAAIADECDGVSRFWCNQHPACITWNGLNGNCYYISHVQCQCRDLGSVIVDVCDLSAELGDGAFEFYYNTDDMVNDYALTYLNPCTGYSSNGPDAVANVYLASGGILEVHMDPEGTMDSSLYLVTDCANPEGTCVAGADVTYSGDEETFTYVSPTDGIYYIIFDAYTSAPGAQAVRVWGDVTGSFTPVETHSWGTIKAMYR